MQQSRFAEGLIRLVINVSSVAQQQRLQQTPARLILRHVTDQGRRRRLRDSCFQPCQHPGGGASPRRDGLPRRHGGGDEDISSGQVGRPIELAGIGGRLEPLQPAIGLDFVAGLQVRHRLIHPHADGAGHLRPAGNGLDLARLQIEAAARLGRFEPGECPAGVSIDVGLGDNSPANRRELALIGDEMPDVVGLRPAVLRQPNRTETDETAQSQIRRDIATHRREPTNKEDRNCRRRKQAEQYKAYRHRQGQQALDQNPRDKTDTEENKRAGADNPAVKVPPRQLAVNQFQSPPYLVHGATAYRRMTTDARRIVDLLLVADEKLESAGAYPEESLL